MATIINEDPEIHRGEGNEENSDCIWNYRPLVSIVIAQ